MKKEYLENRHKAYVERYVNLLLNKGEREEPPRGLKQDIFVLYNSWIIVKWIIYQLMMKHVLVNISWLLYHQVVFDKLILFTDRLIFGNIGIRDRWKVYLDIC